MDEGKVKGQGSYGRCEICKKRFSKRGMARHLKACFARDIEGKKGEPAGSRFHVSVSSPSLSEYWLHLDLSGTAKLGELDVFLRNIWLECCGHLSAFQIEEAGPDMFGYRGRKQSRELDMGRKLDDLLKPGMQVQYEYDFGSTTSLLVRVHARCEGPRRRKAVRLLARNEPIPFECEACKGSASNLCTECQWDGGPFLCDACARSHECGEEMLLPVVNSPRMGVCVYMG